MGCNNSSGKGGFFFEFAWTHSHYGVKSENVFDGASHQQKWAKVDYKKYNVGRDRACFPENFRAVNNFIKIILSWKLVDCNMVDCKNGSVKIKT